MLSLRAHAVFISLQLLISAESLTLYYVYYSSNWGKCWSQHTLIKITKTTGNMYPEFATWKSDEQTRSCVSWFEERLGLSEWIKLHVTRHQLYYVYFNEVIAFPNCDPGKGRSWKQAKTIRTAANRWVPYGHEENHWTDDVQWHKGYSGLRLKGFQSWLLKVLGSSSIDQVQAEISNNHFFAVMWIIIVMVGNSHWSPWIPPWEIPTAKH